MLTLVCFDFSTFLKHFLDFSGFSICFQCFLFCFGFAFLPFSGLTPLSGVSAMASPATVKAMLEARCDPNPEPRGIGHGTSNEFGKKNIGRTTMSEWVYDSFIYPFIPFTSSTARGGGGSFKKSKTIGEIGCCESRMSKQKH